MANLFLPCSLDHPKYTDEKNKIRADDLWLDFSVQLSNFIFIL